MAAAPFGRPALHQESFGSGLPNLGSALPRCEERCHGRPTLGRGTTERKRIPTPERSGQLRSGGRVYYRPRTHGYDAGSPKATWLVGIESPVVVSSREYR